MFPSVTQVCSICRKYIATSGVCSNCARDVQQLWYARGPQKPSVLSRLVSKIRAKF